MLSKKEKENAIIRLVDEGKKYREILKILHVSPNDISSAIKSREGSNTEPSIQTKAYKMFLEGKTPIEVAIALGIGKEEITKLWKEYLEITGHFRLLKIAEELKEKFQPFFKIYNTIKKKGLTLEEIEEGIKRARDIQVKAEYESVFNDEFARNEKLSTELQEQIEEQQNTIANLNVDIVALQFVKMILTQINNGLATEKNRLESVPSYYARYSYERNRNLVPLSYKSIQYY